MASFYKILYKIVAMKSFAKFPRSNCVGTFLQQCHGLAARNFLQKEALA